MVSDRRLSWMVISINCEVRLDEIPQGVIARMLPARRDIWCLPNSTALPRQIVGGLEARKAGTDLIPAERGSLLPVLWF